MYSKSRIFRNVLFITNRIDMQSRDIFNSISYFVKVYQFYYIIPLIYYCFIKKTPRMIKILTASFFNIFFLLFKKVKANKTFKITVRLHRGAILVTSPN